MHIGINSIELLDSISKNQKIKLWHPSNINPSKEKTYKKIVRSQILPVLFGSW